MKKIRLTISERALTYINARLPGIGTGKAGTSTGAAGTRPRPPHHIMAAANRMNTMTGHSNIHALHTNWINGSWDHEGAIGTSVSPSTGEVVGKYLDIGPEQARKAIEMARAAFDSTSWARNRDLRSRALSELADRL